MSIMKIFLILCNIAVLFLNNSFGQTAAIDEVSFTQHDIVIDSSKQQTVLTGFILGGDIAELAVLNIDENDERRLCIYAYDDSTWVPRLDTKLHPEVLFVDMATINGHDRLITYQPGYLSWFDPESESERKLVEVTSNFNPPRSGEIPHIDLSQDLNADNRDDLVVPDMDGFWVFIQMEGGVFADPIMIGPSTNISRIYGADGYRYNPWGQSRVHKMDYNQDSRTDLVFWKDDHFEVHLQNEQGLFAPVVKTFTTDVAFDSDQLSFLTSGEMQGKVLHFLSDLNDDGVGDLVIFSLEGTSIKDKKSAYDIHFGKPTRDGRTEYMPDADLTIQSDGKILLGLDRHDFDHDGKVDLMLTAIETGYLEENFWKKIKGFMGDDIWLDLEFYRMEGSRFPDKPNAIRRRQLDGAPSHREPGWVPLDIVLRGGLHERRKTQHNWPRAFNTTLLIGDVTGDGRSDLLIEETFRNLKVFVGVPGPELFAPQAQTVMVLMPSDEEYTWLVDLNKDGMQDILMHHPGTSEKFSPHQSFVPKPQVTILISHSKTKR